MYEPREVYPNSPLQYVVLELRYPYAPRMRQQQALDSFFGELTDLFPILRPQSQITVAGQLGGPLNQQVEQVMRALNKSANMAVTVSPSSLAIETTNYERFEDFHSVSQRCIDALISQTPIAAIERVGLRYVNEIRAPAKIANVGDWGPWIDARLTAAATLNSSHSAVSTQGTVQYLIAEHQYLTINYAASPEGGGVVGNDPLRRRVSPPDGPFFVIDFDSYWQPPTEQLDDFDRPEIEKRILGLHDPIGGYFQSLISDSLRSIFRKK